MWLVKGIQETPLFAFLGSIFVSLLGPLHFDDERGIPLPQQLAELRGLQCPRRARHFACFNINRQSE